MFRFFSAPTERFHSMKFEIFLVASPKIFGASQKQKLYNFRWRKKMSHQIEFHVHATTESRFKCTTMMIFELDRVYRCNSAVIWFAVWLFRADVWPTDRSQQSLKEARIRLIREDWFELFTNNPHLNWRMDFALRCHALWTQLKRKLWLMHRSYMKLYLCECDRW